MSKFDLNGDGKVDYKDALAAVKKAKRLGVNIMNNQQGVAIWMRLI